MYTESDENSNKKIDLMLNKLGINRKYSRIAGDRVSFFKYGTECDRILNMAEQMIYSKFGSNNIFLLRWNSSDTCALDVIVSDK